MALQDELITMIASDPDDEAPPLVLADLLQSDDDPRGELIVLDHRDRTTPGGVTEPDALERLLLLSAVYGFPHARDHETEQLAFRSRVYLSHYEIDFEGHRHEVRYHQYQLFISTDGHLDPGRAPVRGRTLRGLQRHSDWTYDEMRVILSIVSDALRARTPLAELHFPYAGHPLPVYAGAPRRVYVLPERFTRPRQLPHYDHGLAACDYHRWHALWRRLRGGEAAAVASARRDRATTRR
jgi:uncharacterized protein (TIGR02996 family)